MSPSNMHVLFLPSWYPKKPGDVLGSFFREQATALSKSGTKVGVINLRMLSLRGGFNNFTKLDDVLETFNDEGVETYSKPVKNWFFMVPKLRAYQYVSKGLKLFDRYVSDHGKPDVIHVHSILFAGTLAAAIKEKYNIPYVISEHSSAYLSGIIHTNKYNILQKSSAAAAQRYGVSQNIARHVEKTIGIKSGRWGVMPNSVSDDFLAYPIPKKNQNSFHFAHASFMTPNKRADGIIEAFKGVQEKHPRTHLTLIGEGQCFEELKGRVGRLGLSESVTFTGMLTRPQVVERLSIADAFILNSVHETFGVVLIEAMALGLPVISTRSGGPDSIVTPKTGYLVNVENLGELTASMSQIISERDKFNPRNIRELCRSKYGTAVLVDRWNAIYKDIAASHL